MNDTNANFDNTVRALRETLEANREKQPRRRPTKLKLADLHTEPVVFQPREIESRLAEDECHLKELENAIGRETQKRQPLDPLTVWWGGERYIVVDGHHRLIAYQRRGYTQSIPVVVFEGSLDEAIAKSRALNCKNRLRMTQTEKLNSGWKLVVSTRLSKKQTQAACGIAYGTVGEMRSIKAKLLAKSDVTLASLSEMTWKEARATANGEVTRDLGHEDAITRRAEDYARKLARALHDRPMVDSEAFGRALILLDNRLPTFLMETNSWSESFHNLMDARNAEIADWGDVEDY